MAVKPRRRRNADSTPRLLGEWRRFARAELQTRGIESAAAEADLIAAHVLGVSRIDLILNADRSLKPQEIGRLTRILNRRGERIPLQYLLEDVDFSGLCLDVRPGVFIPRPETEGLVERVLAQLPDEEGWVADIGTGTGAIALAIAIDRPRLRIVATDVSSDAIRLARRNARKLGLSKRVRFMEGDLTEPLEPRWDGRLLALASNPPYIAFEERKLLAPEVVKHEPHRALFAREHGLEIIRRLARSARRLVREGGLFALEIGERQGERVPDVLEAAGGWEEIRIERDLAGKDRYAFARRAGKVR